MKVIVADSSPLIVFARSGMLELLRQVVGEIVLPQTVFEECTGDLSKAGAQSIADAFRSNLITVLDDTQALTTLPPMPMLDRGETSAIALAITLGVPVLMDERLGRQAAHAQGVAVVGSAGVLLAAKQRGLIEHVRPILERWQGYGYFLSPSLIANVLHRAKEAD